MKMLNHLLFLNRKVAKIRHFWNLWLNREGWRMIWDSDQRIPHGSRVRKKLTKIFENILRTYLTTMISCLIWYLCDQWIQAELEGFIQLHLLVWLYFGDCLFKSKNKAKFWTLFLLFYQSGNLWKFTAWNNDKLTIFVSFSNCSRERYAKSRRHWYI